MENQSNNEVQPVPVVKQKPKACCACPETRKARDTCILNNGEDLCFKEIENHKICLRSEGFQA